MIQRKDVSFLIKLLHFSFGEQANMTEEKKKANGKKEKGETFIATVFFSLEGTNSDPNCCWNPKKGSFCRNLQYPFDDSVSVVI